MEQRRRYTTLRQPQQRFYISLLPENMKYTNSRMWAGYVFSPQQKLDWNDILVLMKVVAGHNIKFKVNLTQILGILGLCLILFPVVLKIISRECILVVGLEN
ncbi:hypothetical protein Pfo_015332, partial [Paulownia fortunei]